MLKAVMLGFDAAAETAYLPAFAARKRDIDICAVCDPSAERLEKAAALMPSARRYKIPGTLFSEEDCLDFAVISGPAGLRAGHIMAALGNRLHVFCGRPLCLSMKDLDLIWAESFRAGRCVFTVHGPERSPQVLTLKKVIREKLLGRVSYAALSFLRTGRTEAGILADCGWQAAYLAGELLGGEPVSLSARLQSGEDAETGNTVETVCCQLHFSGAAAHIHLTSKSHADRTGILVCGDKGLANLEEDLLTLDLKGLAPETIKFNERLSDGPGPEWIKASLEDFLAAAKDPALREKNLRESKNCLKFLKNSAYSNSINSATVPL